MWEKQSLREAARKGDPMGRIIFTNVNLVNGDRAAQPRSTVVVEDERITFAGAGKAPAPRPGDRIADLAGKTLMPGMVQSHFHVSYHNLGGWNGPFALENPIPYQTLLAAANAKTVLLAGFTSAVGASTIGTIDATIKRAINAGIIPGPRLMASSMDLVTTGDSPDAVPYWWESHAEGVAKVCDGPDAFRKAVREEIKRGADIIKLYPTGGHGVRLPKTAISITQEEMEAAVQAAHDKGKKVRGHIVTKQMILAGVRAGLDVIDHADDLDAACIDACLQASAFVAPSLYYPLRVMEEFDRRGEGSSPRAQRMRRDFDYTCSILAEASAAGLKLVTGDDFGTTLTPHADAAKELEVYVRHAGVSPLEVIRWATKHGAELMGMGAELGVIATGKLADLLVIDGDPTVDITVLQDEARILAVMKGGKLYKDSLPPVAKER